MATRAVVFDVMGTLFDLAPVRRRLTELGAPEGALEAWFGRMLHSAASLTLVGEFRPFREVGEATLLTTLAQLEVETARADEVLRALGELDAYPDAAAAFDLLDRAGVPAVTLTNGGREHTEKLLESAGLRGRVEQVLTVEEVRAYKPHREPYLHVARTLGLPPASLALIAAHGWDVVGARAAGLSAIWVDRLERRWPFPTAEPPTTSTLVEAVELALAR
ncbi:MAG: haloacid dehalogenase type II [Actinobacteria bacterium]|nr:haloacid dehalogenase type II [Actinomycetota bacterium]